MTLTDELRKLIGTSDMEPVLWQLEERELTNLSRRAILVRDAKRRLGKPYIRTPFLQEVRG